MKLALLAVSALTAIGPLAAQSAVNETSYSTDSASTITVIQPGALTRLIETPAGHIRPVKDASESNTDEAAGETAVHGKTAGYRVQVFSDNNQRTAKGEARTKEKLLREAFPDYGTYIVYNSPFWRLKVGDFRTQHEAEAAADAIKSHFPSFSREVRVVRDRVNTQR